MANTQQLKTILETKVGAATAKIKPLEENTRRILGETAEKLRTTSTDRIKIIEGSLKERLPVASALKLLPKNIDLGSLTNHELFEKGTRVFVSAFQILNQTNEENIAKLQGEIEKLNKKVTSLERRLTSRVQRKDIKPLVTRLEKLEKN